MIEHNLEEELKQLGQDVNKPYNEVLDIYEKQLKRLHDNGMEDSDTTDMMALRAARMAVRITPTLPGRGQPEELIGFLLGDMGLRDQAEMVRREAKRFIAQHDEETAMDEGYITEDGYILDRREKVFGRINPNHGEILDPGLEVLSINLWGIMKRAGGDFELSMFSTSNNELSKAWTRIKVLKPCRVWAIPKGRKANYESYSGSVAEDTTSTFRALKGGLDESIYEIFQRVFQGQIMPINEIEKFHNSLPKKKGKVPWNSWLVTRGIIDNINTDNKTVWGIPALLSDPYQGHDYSYRIRVFLSNESMVSIGDLSEVYIFGKTRRAKFKDHNSQQWEDADVVIDVYSLLPVEGFITPQGFKGRVQREIAGWED